jgi:hypothetical protein
MFSGFGIAVLSLFTFSVLYGTSQPLPVRLPALAAVDIPRQLACGYSSK